MSPRKGPRRPAISIRLSEAGLSIIDDLAHETGVSRSELIRTLLTEAIQVRRRQGKAS